MIGEVDIFGVFVPPLLLWIGAALALVAALKRLLSVMGVYRFVWHRPLFDLALLVLAVGGLTALGAGWGIP